MNDTSSQSQAPLFEALLKYAAKPLIPFHTPGHKAGRGLERAWPDFSKLAELDLTEITGFQWAKSLAAAERLAAQFFKADRSFFLVQGASQGICAALLGCFRPGDRVLVGRNCHLSVINGLILADLVPVFVEIDLIPGWSLPAGVNILSLKAALVEHPDCRGLLLTNPTYQGIATQLQQYRELLGERLLIIDEAHGGHLGWTGLDGFDAYNQADLWVQGTHKILGSFTQTGMLHLREGRVNPDQIEHALALITTTSPSFPLLASLDSNRRFLAQSGRIQFKEGLESIRGLIGNIEILETVSLLMPDSLQNPQRTVDPWKIVISFGALGLKGLEAEKILVREFRIQPEYSDLEQVTFFISPWQEPQDFSRLAEAVAAIAKQVKGNKRQNPELPRMLPQAPMRPREASLGRRELLKLTQTPGRTAATVIAAYPPGMPVVVPGEVITLEAIEFIQAILGLGGQVRGITPQGEVWVCV